MFTFSFDDNKVFEMLGDLIIYILLFVGYIASHYYILSEQKKKQADLTTPKEQLRTWALLAKWFPVAYVIFVLLVLYVA